MPRPSRRHLVLGVLLCGSVAFLLYSLRSEQSPAASRARARHRTSASATAPASEGFVPSAAPAGADFGRYELLASRNIFALRSSASPPPKAREKLPEPPPFPPATPSSPASKAPDLTGWSYVGYVILDGKKLGILQNESSQSCQCLALGETFLGAKVEEVTGEAIHLSSGISRSTLSRTRDFPVAPLDKGAGAEPRPVRRQ